jgi:hypothetical protein
MKKLYLIAVLTAICLLGLNISAPAEDLDGAIVTVPFEFVAGGVTLPAGEYRVDRVSSNGDPELAIRSYNKGGGAFLLPITFAAVADGQPKLSFEQVGDKHFLSQVETLRGVYTLGLPRAAAALARMKDQGTSSSSGTN